MFDPSSSPFWLPGEGTSSGSGVWVPIIMFMHRVKIAGVVLGTVAGCGWWVRLILGSKVIDIKLWMVGCRIWEISYYK